MVPRFKTRLFNVQHTHSSVIYFGNSWKSFSEYRRNALKMGRNRFVATKAESSRRRKTSTLTSEVILLRRFISSFFIRINLHSLVPSLAEVRR